MLRHRHGVGYPVRRSDNYAGEITHCLSGRGRQMHRSLHAHSDESSDEAEDGSDDAADTDKLLEVATCSCIAIDLATC